MISGHGPQTGQSTVRQSLVLWIRPVDISADWTVYGTSDLVPWINPMGYAADWTVYGTLRWDTRSTSANTRNVFSPSIFFISAAL